MKKILKQAATLAVQSPAFTAMVSLLESAGNKRTGLLRILTYHRVDWPQSRPLLYPRTTVTPDDFEEQMAFLAKHYNVLSMPEVLQITRSEGTMPPRAVLVTFDDAYCDFAENAWPILQRFNLPVTLFVPTAFPDHPEQTFWWDRLHQAFHSTTIRDDLHVKFGRLSMATAENRIRSFVMCREFVKTLPHHDAMIWVDEICQKMGMGKPGHYILSWNALRQLARDGVTLGAHTRRHPLVNRIMPEEARAEAVSSRQDLAREIGQVLPIFAYPSGGFNNEVVQLLREEGFELGFTTERGINDMSKVDKLQLKRINVGPGTKLPMLRAQLLSGHAYIS